MAFSYSVSLRAERRCRVRLSNDKGERCLLKVLSPDDFGAEIRRDFQSWLGQQGFPCPKVLVPLVYIDGLPIVIEEYVDEGRRADEPERRSQFDCG